MTVLRRLICGHLEKRKGCNYWLLNRAALLCLTLCVPVSERQYSGESRR